MFSPCTFLSFLIVFGSLVSSLLLVLLCVDVTLTFFFFVCLFVFVTIVPILSSLLSTHLEWRPHFFIFFFFFWNGERILMGLV